MADTWGEFAAAEPELAAFGAERLHGTVAYLATTRADGTPRVHPVTPIIGDGRLFIFMEPTSPKGADLGRDGAYALHSTVGDSSGAGGEFAVRGRAAPVDDPTTRALAAAASTYPPAERYVLFMLGITGAHSIVYEDGRATRCRWGAI